MTIDLTLVAKFKKIFSGNPQAYGAFFPKEGESGRGETIRNPVQIKDFEKHLYGDVRGVGIIPIMDQEYSCFGVIDYDNHMKKDGINIIKLEKEARKLKAPLVICRSRSGGAHAYLFGKEPLNTRILRQTLKNYSEQLKGYGELEIEIFPKQNTLDKHMVGNWINLPYFNVTDTGRYAIIDGKKATLEQFLTFVEKVSISNADMIELGSEVHKEAPPCIEKLLREKLPSGNRNSALFNFSVYVYKAFPENWQPLVYKYNAENFHEPLKHDEVSNVIQSVIRNPDYRYKCKEEPCKSRCDSSKCVIRKFGITPTERTELMMTKLPHFGKLRKYLTDPVKYELIIEGKKILLTSEDLLIFNRFRRVVFEQLDKVLKTVKPEVWMEIVDKLVKNVELIEVPDDASRNGLVRSLLLEYIKQANLQDSGKNIEKRKLLTSGHPVVQEMKTEFGLSKRYVLFKGVDFRRAIQSKRLGNLVGADIWLAIKDMGVRSFTVRDTEKKVIRVWGVPLIEDTPHPDVYLDDFEEYKNKNNLENNIEKLETVANTDFEIDYSQVSNVEDMVEFKPEF